MKILCVCHNTPYPPNKGDKIRTFHLLKNLAKEHEIHLVAIAKDPKDVEHKEALEQWCSSVEIIPLNPLLSKFYALVCLLLWLPLTLGFFFSFKMRKAIDKIAKEEIFDATLAVCSSVAHYCKPVEAEIRIVDFIDIDSEKWRQYQSIHSFPKSLIYGYEAKRLQDTERKIHLETTFSVVTSQIEKQRLEKLSGENGSRILIIPQGVSLEFYSEQMAKRTPERIVFTGQMDYLPNIDAVIYFHDHVLPQLKALRPNIQFYVVGRNPDASLAHECPNAIITGEVQDIREYLHSASVVVAPLRLAFGMQSKILEAMASGIPVVASDKAANSLWAKPDEHLLVAKTVDEFAESILMLEENSELSKKLSVSGKKYVEEFHDWELLMEPLLLLIRGEDEEQNAGFSGVGLCAISDDCKQVL